MPETNKQARAGSVWQRGLYSVEFALVVIVLLTFLFGIIDIGRAMYMVNTLPEVTRRAATAVAQIDPSASGTVTKARYHAIFRGDAGSLLLGAPITDEYVRVDYLALVRGGDGSLTMTPVPTAILEKGSARNRLTCAADPNSPDCIRLVRARICAPGDASACAPVYYAPLLYLFPRLMRLPTATTIVPADTLGYVPGTAPGA